MRNIIETFLPKQDTEKVVQISVDKIVPSRYQPRLKFKEETLQELSTSIKNNGLIQPIAVRAIENGKYEIITGERRYRACCMAEFKTVPCYVLSPTEEQAAAMALIENIQREDLSAVEEARSYTQIMAQTNMTQGELAEKVGKSQSAIANKIRLLNLPMRVQDGVIDGKITERHARALLSVPRGKREEVYDMIVKSGMTVHQTEVYIEGFNKQQRPRRRKQKTKGFTRNYKIALNTIKTSVKMIRDMGVDAKMDTEETDSEIRMIVRIPKAAKE